MSPPPANQRSVHKLLWHPGRPSLICLRGCFAETLREFGLLNTCFLDALLVGACNEALSFSTGFAAGGRADLGLVQQWGYTQVPPKLPGKEKSHTSQVFLWAKCT